MGTRVFAEKGKYKLVSDERDIMVSNMLINDVIQWCEQTGIVAEQVANSPIIQWSFGVNLWRVKDDEQRVMFALRWS